MTGIDTKSWQKYSIISTKANAQLSNSIEIDGDSVATFAKTDKTFVYFFATIVYFCLNTKISAYIFSFL